MSVELVSVHIPKTAGGSFLGVLQSVYGVECVRYEDTDRILDPLAVYNLDPVRWARQAEEDRRRTAPEVKVIHGHFPASKYRRSFPSARRIVWLRDPVARLVSHYFFWRSTPPEVSGHTLHAYMRDRDLDLLGFARLPMMRNILTRAFLEDAVFSDFDFVGIQEHFAEELADLGKLLGWPRTPQVWENRNRAPDYEGERERILSDPETVRPLTELNRDDMDLYCAALRLRRERLGC